MNDEHPVKLLAAPASPPHDEEEETMRYSIRSIASPAISVRRLGALDAAHLEAHCLRLAPHDALNLFGAQAEPIAVRRYLAGVDFHWDIILAGLEREGTVRATARVRTQRGSRWAELLPAREHNWVAAEQWNEIICAAVESARTASIGWLSVASLGYDPETRDALRLAGFDLQAEADGTIGELCLGHERNRRVA